MTPAPVQRATNNPITMYISKDSSTTLFLTVVVVVVVVAAAAAEAELNGADDDDLGLAASMIIEDSSTPLCEGEAKSTIAEEDEVFSTTSTLTFLQYF